FSLSILSSVCRRHLPSFPTRRSSDSHVEVAQLALLRDDGLARSQQRLDGEPHPLRVMGAHHLRIEQGDERPGTAPCARWQIGKRSEEHTSELQSRENLVCRLLLEKKN